MPIRVICKHCGKQFSAWDDLIGKTVQCPKCHQQMVVHSGNDALGEAATPATPPQAAAPARRPIAPPPPVHSTRVPTRPMAPRMPASQPPAPPSTSGGHAFDADDIDDNDQLPYSCPHCNQSMPVDEDLCDHCGYHRVLKRRIDISDGIHKPDKSVGFERLFKGQLADADSAESTLLLIKVIGGLIAAAFLFVCHPWSWLVAIVGVAGYFAYRHMRQTSTSGEGNGDPSGINQDVASTLLWSLALSFQRAVGWRLPEWPFPTTNALTLHDSTFTDHDLSEVEDLSNYQTLDLEGTQLSNAGLEELEKLKQLRYLVVRRTNATVAGVQRLQQALPKVSIWY